MTSVIALVFCHEAGREHPSATQWTHWVTKIGAQGVWGSWVCRNRVPEQGATQKSGSRNLHEGPLSPLLHTKLSMYRVKFHKNQQRTAIRKLEAEQCPEATGLWKFYILISQKLDQACWICGTFNGRTKKWHTCKTARL